MTGFAIGTIAPCMRWSRHSLVLIDSSVNLRPMKRSDSRDDLVVVSGPRTVAVLYCPYASESLYRNFCATQNSCFLEDFSLSIFLSREAHLILSAISSGKQSCTPFLEVSSPAYVVYVVYCSGSECWSVDLAYRGR